MHPCTVGDSGLPGIPPDHGSASVVPTTSAADGYGAARRTYRLGYPSQNNVRTALVKSIYAVPTWTRLVALVTERGAQRATITACTR
jgi:hypothetical protein